jgi:hypothetical protein
MESLEHNELRFTIKIVNYMQLYTSTEKLKLLKMCKFHKTLLPLKIYECY